MLGDELKRKMDLYYLQRVIYQKNMDEFVDSLSAVDLKKIKKDKEKTDEGGKHPFLRFFIKLGRKAKKNANKILRIIDIPLGSFAAAFPPASIPKEFKEGVEIVTEEAFTKKDLNNAMDSEDFEKLLSEYQEIRKNRNKHQQYPAQSH